MKEEDKKKLENTKEKVDGLCGGKQLEDLQMMKESMNFMMISRLVAEIDTLKEILVSSNTINKKEYQEKLVKTIREQEERNKFIQGLEDGI